MTLTVPLTPCADFLTQHPWPAVVLIFILGVVLPAVWCPRQRDAALTVLTLVLAAAAAIAAAVRGTRR